MAYRLTKKEKRDATRRLRELLPHNTTVKSVCTGRPRSNMGGRYVFLVATLEVPWHDRDDPDAKPVPVVTNITSAMSDVLGWKWCDDGSMFVSGFGLNRPHHAVRSLASLLRKEGETGEDYDLKWADL